MGSRHRTRIIRISTAVAALVVMAGCGSSAGGASGSAGGAGSAAAPASTSDGYTFGTLPKEGGTPKDGGTVKVALPPGAAPNYILPIVPAKANSVYVTKQFQWLMFRPLYWYPTGMNPKINADKSIAELPKYSNGNKTVTITLRSGLTWSGGDPISASDVVFDIQLIKAALKLSPANWAGYTPGQFPDNVVSAKATNASTVVLELDKAYNPQWFTNNQLTNITPLPSQQWNRDSDSGAPLDSADPADAAKIYTYLNKQSNELATFATNPLWQNVSGPFKLSSYTPSTGANTMVPNEKYWGTKPRIDKLEQMAFTSAAAELNALRSGEITMGPVDASQLAQVPQLQKQGYNVFGAPNFGFSFIMLNFKNTTDNNDKIIGQRYVREVLQRLIDTDSLIKSKSVYNGAAAPSYGTVPGVPTNDFASDDSTVSPYPFDPKAAAESLTSHGWDVQPNGTTTCTKPGTGDDQCGEGIPAGQAINFSLFHSDQTAANEVICNTFASEAKKLGITITVQPKTFGYMITNFNNPAAPANADAWSMEQWGGFTITPYPTANGTFNTTGSGNVGSYSSTEADKLIEQSVFGSDSMAVKAEGDFLRKDLPVLWLPSPDKVWAWQQDLSGPPDSFSALTQSSFSPEDWYFTS
ncbi:ABC transporter substrate-binding protein [Nakamurella lactea]|uniref:ABC transporter substrate-binding protein n=1 Tax=Nakamurella lactea TaxID=459515 RepID=UPI0003FF51CC|nr:ABC transporter substrate-binding protein [Nakamurella lactea]